MEKCVAVIPARGGSKGVPRKNIKPLGGTPLIGYTVSVARQAGMFSRIAVSTEDAEIAAVARSLGAEVIDRPAALAEDDTKSEPVLAHALGVLESRGESYDGVMLLSPTNPFRDARAIRDAVRCFETDIFDTIVGLQPIFKHQFDVQGSFAVQRVRVRENRQTRRPVWLENGALYLTRAEIVRAGAIFGERLGYIEMDPLASVNIDSALDFLFAEAVIRAGIVTPPR